MPFRDRGEIVADRIRIDFDRVGQSVEFVRQAAAQIRATLDTLDAQLALMENAWEGEAFEAYKQARTHWETQMRAMQKTLDAYSEVLLTTGSAMAQAESELAKSF